jgi:NAD(P)H-dependent FMN reductase
MVKIGIVLASTRPNRFGSQPANWLYGLAQERGDADYDFIDLAEIGLPLLDEPNPPSQGNYQHEHTKKWSKRVKALDGFAFVTPEYNHGVPAALKNAIDFLYAEWNFKAAAFVSYGGPAGGSRSVEILRCIMAELKIYDIREQMLLSSYHSRLNEAGEYQFTAKEAETANGLLEQLVFWSGVMKDARAKLES